MANKTVSTIQPQGQEGPTLTVLFHDRGYKLQDDTTTIPPLTPNGIVWRIHWDKIDAGVNWVAVDSTGGVFGYKNKPKRLNYVFSNTDNIQNFLFKIEERPDWHTLIFSRPK